MGIETALAVAAIGGSVISAGSSIYAGVQSNNQAKQAAAIEQMNASLAAQETQNAINARTEEMNRIKEANKMAMLKSGMNLSGSNLLAIEDTKRQLALDINDLQIRGYVSQQNYSMKENQLLSSGRAAMIGGYTKAAGTLLSTAASFNTPSRYGNGSGGGSTNASASAKSGGGL